MKLMLPIFLSSFVLANTAIASSLPVEVTPLCDRLDEAACHQHSACTWVGSSLVNTNGEESVAHCKLRVNDKLEAAKAKVLDRVKKNLQKASRSNENRQQNEFQSTAQVSSVAQAPRSNTSNYFGGPAKK